MATISPRTYPLDWKPIPTTPEWTSINRAELGLTSDIQAAFLPGVSNTNYEPEAPVPGLTIDLTGIPTTSTAFGTALDMSGINTGPALSDSSVLSHAGDFTHVIACRTPATVSSADYILADTSASQQNYTVILLSDFRIVFASGDGGTNVASIQSDANLLLPSTDYVLIFQRQGTYLRMWAFEQGSDFVYDPGDYDPVLGTGNNLGETEIGVAPNTGSVSWEPVLEGDAIYSGGATSNTLFLYGLSDTGSNTFNSPAIYSHVAYERAISFQEAAAHGFRPFRLFDAMDLTSDVTQYRGISRFIESESTPPIYFAAGSGVPPYLDGLPAGLQSHPSFIPSNWVQQSQFGAPGISNFVPMMGINETGMPTDNRMRTDSGAGTESGLIANHRKVSFNASAYNSANGSGADAMAALNNAVLSVLDLEQAYTGDPSSFNIEAPIGYYSWFYREELGIEFAARDFGDLIIGGWERPQNNWVSKTDLEDKADLQYWQMLGGMVCPFYWNFYDEATANPGTDAVSRTDHLLTDSFYGGIQSRIRTTRYMAEYGDIPFWVAIRVDSGGEWGSQEVFDAQMELAMRVGDGISQFQGIYIWGSSSTNAVNLLNEWAFNGDGAAIFLQEEGGGPLASPFCHRHPFMPTYLGNTATQRRTSMPWSPGCTTDS